MPEGGMGAVATTEATMTEAMDQIETQPLVDFEVLRDALSIQVETVQRQFKLKHRDLLRWAHKQGYDLPFLGAQISRGLMAGGLMASLLIGVPQSMTGLSTSQELQQQQVAETQAQMVRAQHLKTVQAAALARAQAQQQLMTQLQSLSSQHQLTNDSTLAQQAAETLTDLTGVTAVTSLDGYQLNTNIGRIGAEQHLKRFPGDTITQHATTVSGMAPGLGAYGYFASSKTTLTQEAINREAWYVAIQTFQSPQWHGNVKAAYDWFRYRKVMVYDPVTGKAVVADVADAGPALSTGKAYGGSPEVMMALGAHDGAGSPPVMMFFVDDPQNQVPLGPVQFKTDPFSLAGGGQ